MEVFLIGGTGSTGQHVAQQLVATGHTVTVFHRGQTSADLPDGVTSVHGNRDETTALRTAIDTASPDVVVDAILYTEAQAATLVNVCTGNTDRLVVLSSEDIYRQYDGLRGHSSHSPDPVPLTETAPLRRSWYPYRGSDTDFVYAHDYDKRLVEQQVRAAPVPATVLRLPKVYGPGGTDHHVGHYLDRLQSSVGPIALGEQQARWRWSRGYVENVAAVIVRATVSTAATGRAHNVGEPDALPEATWIQRIAAVAEGETPIEVASGDPGEESSLDWTYDVAMDTRRLRTELDFAERISHEEALRRTIAWERQTESAPR